MIKYECSDGSKVSEATIKRKLSEEYRKKYEGEPHPTCFECGLPAQGSAHIIPKARCKELHKTELIWDWENFVPMCHKHNLAIECISSPDFKLLSGYEYYLDFFRRHDLESYFKAI